MGVHPPGDRHRRREEERERALSKTIDRHFVARSIRSRPSLSLARAQANALDLERLPPTRTMDGRVEGLVASQICDKTDQTLLTWKEIKDGYGSCSNFCRSMGLKSNVSPGSGRAEGDFQRHEEKLDLNNRRSIDRSDNHAL